MIFEEKVKQYKEVSRKIEELEAQKKSLSQEILGLMPQDTKTVFTNDYQVRLHSRLFIKTTLTEARLFNAIKLQETVDKEKLKALYNEGHPIPNISKLEYISIVNHRVIL